MAKKYVITLKVITVALKHFQQKFNLTEQSHTLFLAVLSQKETSIFTESS